MQNGKIAKAETERRVIGLYLRAWNTQESIATDMSVNKSTISRIIEKLLQNSIDGKMQQNFEPYLYNIWNLHKQVHGKVRAGV